MNTPFLALLTSVAVALLMALLFAGLKTARIYILVGRKGHNT